MDDLRRELEALKEEMALAGVGRAPMVVGVRQVGVDGEDRKPGLYRTGRAVVIVTDGPDGPSAEQLAEFFPLGGSPLLIGGEARSDLL